MSAEIKIDVIAVLNSHIEKNENNDDHAGANELRAVRDVFFDLFSAASNGLDVPRTDNPSAYGRYYAVDAADKIRTVLGRIIG